MKRTFQFLGKVWQPLQMIVDVLKPARFSLFVVLFGGGILLLTGQGREIALRVTDNWLHAAAFYVAILLWAVQSWFWARRILDEAFKADDEVEPFRQWLIDHVPRILGVLAYLLAGAALVLAWFSHIRALPHALLTLLVLATGVVFYVFMVKRRKLMQRWLKDPRWTGKGGDLEYLRRWLTWITLVYALLFTVLASVAPAAFGFTVGSAAVLFFALSTIVPVGSWLVYKTEEHNFPVVITLLLLALIFSFFNDNHELRPTGTDPQRKPLKEALAHWSEQATVVRETPRSEPTKPLLVVATAGGGLRAAYWTATVLGAAADAAPEFRRSLFAVSGVSGGSVGATFFNAILREDNRDCQDAESRGESATCYEWQAHRALSQDFLGPAIAGMLYPDLLQRFFPVPINALPDRAEALEQGWQVGWQNVYGETRTEGLVTPFTGMWTEAFAENGPWLPQLLLNGTHQETGKRLVASSLVLAPEVFNDVIDLYDVFHADIPATTAAINSARFPYLSPPGTLPCRAPADQSALMSEVKSMLGHVRCNKGHVLDGGYFENFGAVTALELIHAGLASDHYRPKDQLEGVKLRPVVILISSDPGLVVRRDPLPEGEYYRQCPADGEVTDKICLDEPFDTLPGNPGVNETLGPVLGMFNTRDARGVLAAKSLRWWVDDCVKNRGICGGEENTAAPYFLHFRMQVDEGMPDPALGWLLSEESEVAIRNMLTCGEHNRDAMEALLLALGVPRERIDAAIACPDEKS